MSTATEKKLMTAEEFLALPDDGVERWLIRGNVWEITMTKRNRFHSTIEGEITGHIWAWIQTQPLPRGRITCGEVGFLLQRNPDTTVGIDVAYISPVMAAANPPDTTLFDGPPMVAIEIQSPNDKLQVTTKKLKEYLAAGVEAVWVVNPDMATVTIYRKNQPAMIFSNGQTVTGDPELPGFSAKVADFFR